MNLNLSSMWLKTQNSPLFICKGVDPRRRFHKLLMEKIHGDYVVIRKFTNWKKMTINWNEGEDKVLFSISVIVTVNGWKIHKILNKKWMEIFVTIWDVSCVEQVEAANCIKKKLRRLLISLTSISFYNVLGKCKLLPSLSSWLNYSISERSVFGIFV